MKRSIAGLCAFSLCGIAAAQSSVTLFGVVDTALSLYRADGSGSVARLTTGNASTSRLGFRGTEDLGGGMTASFWLESGLLTDSGAGSSTNTNNQPSGTGSGGAGGVTFNRRSTVSWSGRLGELRLGRDYTPSFWNLAVFDPFGVLGSAQSSNLSLANSTVTNARASNSVGYFFPGCSVNVGCTGFYGQVMHARGENASGTATSKDGNYTGARVGFGAPSWNVAAASGTTASDAAGNFRQSNIGATYDFGVAKLFFQHGINKTGKVGGSVAGVSKATHYMLGATIPVGQGYIPLSYNHVRFDNASASNASQLGIGYVHRLSARTSLYTFYGRISNNDGVTASPRFTITGGAAVATVNGKASGLDLGIRHVF